MEDHMAYYIGLDVSQKETWICVVDDKGKTVVEGTWLFVEPTIE